MAELGTTQRPAVLRVQSMERADEIMAIAERNGWKVIIGVDYLLRENRVARRKLVAQVFDPAGGTA